MLLNRIWEQLDSNINRNTGCRDWGVSWFFTVPSYQFIIQSSHHWTLYSLAANSVVKNVYISLPLILYSYGVEIIIFLWIYTQSLELFGREIGPSQGLCPNKGRHKHRKTHTHTHPHTHIKHQYPKWDSSPRSQRPSERNRCTGGSGVK
jgi:hypothetical protein